jgi:hypothetical protein
MQLGVSALNLCIQFEDSDFMKRLLSTKEQEWIKVLSLHVLTNPPWRPEFIPV